MERTGHHFLPSCTEEETEAQTGPLQSLTSGKAVRNMDFEATHAQIQPPDLLLNLHVTLGK